MDRVAADEGPKDSFQFVLVLLVLEISLIAEGSRDVLLYLKVVRMGPVRVELFVVVTRQCEVVAILVVTHVAISTTNSEPVLPPELARKPLDHVLLEVNLVLFVHEILVHVEVVLEIKVVLSLETL